MWRIAASFFWFSWLLVTSVAAGDVRLSVAASLTNAFKDLVSIYSQQAPQVRLLPNFAASGALAKQISQGAPADIFVAANPQWMQYLVDMQLVPAGQVRTLAHTTLVFVGGKDLAATNLANLVDLERIAIGSPGSVPAGRYAVQALKAAGLYGQLGEQLVLAKDVRQALIYADRGEVDGAFVYRTDALLVREAEILFEVPQALYDEISYPAGLTSQGAANPEAVAFFDFLGTQPAAEILRRPGFIVP